MIPHFVFVFVCCLSRGELLRIHPLPLRILPNFQCLPYLRAFRRRTNKANEKIPRKLIIWGSNQRRRRPFVQSYQRPVTRDSSRIFQPPSITLNWSSHSLWTQSWWWWLMRSHIYTLSRIWAKLVVCLCGSPLVSEILIKLTNWERRLDGPAKPARLLPFRVTKLGSFNIYAQTQSISTNHLCG